MFIQENKPKKTNQETKKIKSEMEPFFFFFGYKSVFLVKESSKFDKKKMEVKVGMVSSWSWCVAIIDRMWVACIKRMMRCIMN